MSSQRFCLRWNNHQSNLLSVFDQLLHAETFTDVTLAIDGQYLKAHKVSRTKLHILFNTLQSLSLFTLHFYDFFLLLSLIDTIILFLRRARERERSVLRLFMYLLSSRSGFDFWFSTCGSFSLSRHRKYKNSTIALKSSVLRDVNCGRETELAWDFETCLFLLICLSDTELVSLSLLDLPSPTLSDRSPRANWGEDFKLFPNLWSLYPDKARVSLTSHWNGKYHNDGGMGCREWGDKMSNLFT